MEHSTYANRLQLKKRLVASGLMVYACDGCGVSEWRGKPLALQLEHVNGIGDDNRISNLRLLCPNGHSQTDTFCGRNVRIRRKARPRSAEGGTRTPTGFPPTHFECAAAAITPPRLGTGESVSGTRTD